MFTPPRHPQSNGQAENFVRTYKSCISATQPKSVDELLSITDSFLLQYRASKQATTNETPSKLFLGRELRTSAAMDTTRVIFRKGNDGIQQEGVAIGKKGKTCLEIIDLTDGSVHLRHRDQIFIPNDNNNITDNTTSQPDMATDAISQESPEELPSTEELQENSQSTTTTPALRRSTRERRSPQFYRASFIAERKCNSSSSQTLYQLHHQSCQHHNTTSMAKPAECIAE